MNNKIIAIGLILTIVFSYIGFYTTGLHPVLILLIGGFVTAVVDIVVGCFRQDLSKLGGK